MDKDTRRLLKQNPELEFLKDKGIVRCKLNGHEMPCRVDIIDSFVKGKKFKRLRDNQQSEKLPEHLSSSVIHKGKIFCGLTNCYINCSAGNIERHTTGRKYQRALHQFQQGDLQLYKEEGANEEVEDSSKDQQTSNTDSSCSDDENDIDDHDGVNDDHDGVTDDQDDKIFDDQQREMDDLIQTTAAVSKQRRKRKKLTVKGKSKNARTS